jgi:hypothetical protein
VISAAKLRHSIRVRRESQCDFDLVAAPSLKQ